MMKTYRCTRNAPYMHRVEQTDKSLRQGYYVQAQSESDALAYMTLTFSDDRDGFTVELWIT